MDDIFGEENFVNEIIWSYKRWSNSKKGLMNAHQNIFFYSKTKDFKFFPEFTDYSPTTNIDQILQARDRNIHNKSAYKRDGNGDIVLGKEKIGVPLSDIWEIPFLNPKAKERVGYPTQKPIILVERIINLTTQENDTILDPFCGSGTTIVAAALNNRNYIGIDISKEAIELTRQRLSDRKKTISALLKKGASAYLNKDDYIRQILYQLDAVVVERNKGIDGFLKKHYNNKPVAVYVQRKNQTIQEALELVKMATRSKKVEKIILVRTNDRATLFDDKLYEFNKDIISIESLDFQLITKFNSLPISA
jgi:site-specific DNA-methyltransferase (adenine-specific)